MIKKRRIERDQLHLTAPAFGDALHAEWTKLRSVRSTAWSLLSLVVLTVLFSAFATSALDTSGGSPGNPGNSDVVMLGLSGVYLGQIGAVVLGVLVMAAEYGTGMIRATFVANPRRVDGAHGEDHCGARSRSCCWTSGDTCLLLRRRGDSAGKRLRLRERLSGCNAG